MSGRPKILFVAEAVTLAHVARLAVLTDGLDKDKYELFFATDPRYSALFPDLSPFQYDIWSISSEDFLNALAGGRPLYSKAILERYVEDDLQLIDKIQPDLIVGDFRLSLSVSARLRQIPYAAITNVYWSIHSDNNYTVPDLPMTRLLGVPLAQFFFTLARPLAFARHCIPLNRVRRRYGLKSLGYDLRSIYSDADEVLLADLPHYFPIPTGATHHRYIGPLTWSPSGNAPRWWSEIDKSRPIVYVTLGSSGNVTLLPLVLRALAGLPVTVIASTAGRAELTSVPANALVGEFIPGEEAAQMAVLVICNGGSLTTYQALGTGTPVLGIVSNLDQHLNMSYLQQGGIGEVIRSEEVSLATVSQAVDSLLSSPDRNAHLEKAQQLILASKPQERFSDFLQEMFTAGD